MGWAPATSGSRASAAATCSSDWPAGTVITKQSTPDQGDRPAGDQRQAVGGGDLLGHAAARGRAGPVAIAVGVGAAGRIVVGRQAQQHQHLVRRVGAAAGVAARAAGNARPSKRQPDARGEPEAPSARASSRRRRQRIKAWLRIDRFGEDDGIPGAQIGQGVRPLGGRDLQHIGVGRGRARRRSGRPPPSGPRGWSARACPGGRSRPCCPASPNGPRRGRGTGPAAAAAVAGRTVTPTATRAQAATAQPPQQRRRCGPLGAAGRSGGAVGLEPARQAPPADLGVERQVLDGLRPGSARSGPRPGILRSPPDGPRPGRARSASRRPVTYQGSRRCSSRWPSLS